MIYARNWAAGRMSNGLSISIAKMSKLKDILWLAALWAYSLTFRTKNRQIAQITANRIFWLHANSFPPLFLSAKSIVETHLLRRRNVFIMATGWFFR
jgi:hypothetical protein